MKVKKGQRSSGKVKGGQRRPGNIRECRRRSWNWKVDAIPGLVVMLPWDQKLCKDIHSALKSSFSEWFLLHHIKGFVTHPSFLIALSEHNNNLWFLLENHLPKIIPGFWQWSLGCNVFLGWIITLKDKEIGPGYQHGYCFRTRISHIFFRLLMFNLSS